MSASLASLGVEARRGGEGDALHRGLAELLLEEDGGDRGGTRAERVSQHDEPRLLLLELEHLDALANLGRVLVEERVG